MDFVLREQTDAKPYATSYAQAMEAPAEAVCLISVLCHGVTYFAQLALSEGAAKKVAYDSGVIISLAVRLCIGLFLYKVVNKKIMRYSRGIAMKSDILGAETSRQESQVLAVGQTARVVVFLVTALTCLPVFQVNVSTVLSFCGMGGLAISLLSKGVFLNLVGSLTIYLTQPFTLGDWIQTMDGEVDGWVQSMGPYHTVVKRWDQRPLYIPNSRLTQVQIINASRMTNRRILMEIPLRFGDLDKVTSIIEDITDMITNHKAIDPEQHRLVRLRNIDEFAAIIWVSCYTKGINLRDFVDVRQDVILSIKNIFFKYGTTFATSLERELSRVNASGAFIGEPFSSYDQLAAAGSGAAAAVDVGANASPLPISAASSGSFVAASGEQEGENPTLSPQRALLREELKRMKKMQERIFKREKELKEIEASLADERQRTEREQEQALFFLSQMEQQENTLEEELRGAAQKEAYLQAEEEEIDGEMDELQIREDALDQLLKKSQLAQATAAAAEPSLVEGAAEEEKDPIGIDEADRERVAQADRVIEIGREMLSAERKVIEQEREILKEQIEQEEEELEQELAEGEGAESPEEGAKRSEESDDEDGAPSPDDEANIQKIAESLGGE